MCSGQTSKQFWAKFFQENMGLDCASIGKLILAIIFPPLFVCFHKGCGTELLINIVLTMLACIPGMIHAIFIAME